MFGIGTRVHIALGAGTVPGVCVSAPEPDTYINRRGVAVRTQRIAVISKRINPNDPEGRVYWQLSYETATLLSARNTVEPALDVTEDGAPIPLSQLWDLQRASLQAYLARRQTGSPPARRSRQAASEAASAS